MNDRLLHGTYLGIIIGGVCVQEIGWWGMLLAAALVLVTVSVHELTHRRR